MRKIVAPLFTLALIAVGASLAHAQKQGGTLKVTHRDNPEENIWFESVEKLAIAKKQADLDKLVEDKLNIQKVALEKKLKDEIQSKSKVEIEDLRAHNLEQSKQIEESH